MAGEAGELLDVSLFEVVEALLHSVEVFLEHDERGSRLPLQMWMRVECSQRFGPFFLISQWPEPGLSQASLERYLAAVG